MVAGRARDRDRHRQPEREEAPRQQRDRRFPCNGGIAPSTVASSGTDALIVDGWWANGQGLFAWSDPRDSASLAADGLPLVSYPLDGKPATLATTLPYPSFAVPGLGGVTLVTGGDRYPWNAKTIAGCAVSGQCGPAMDATPAPVNLDPTATELTRGEPLLAFVHGAAETTAGLSQQELRAWYLTRKLWVWEGTGGNPQPITRAGAGVAAPTWSANYQDILYVRDNALWLVPCHHDRTRAPRRQPPVRRQLAERQRLHRLAIPVRLGHARQYRASAEGPTGNRRPNLQRCRFPGRRPDVC